jgi:hypothetical protein
MADGNRVAFKRGGNLKSMDLLGMSLSRSIIACTFANRAYERIFMLIASQFRDIAVVTVMRQPREMRDPMPAALIRALKRA